MQTCTQRCTLPHNSRDKLKKKKNARISKLILDARLHLFNCTCLVHPLCTAENPNTTTTCSEICFQLYLVWFYSHWFFIYNLFFFSWFVQPISMIRAYSNMCVLDIRSSSKTHVIESGSCVKKKIPNQIIKTRKPLNIIAS